MSIGWFNSITSGFHQQPLPSTSGIEGKGSVTTEEVIHQWDINDFVVFLIKEQGSLKYKTTDRDQKEIYTNCIEISEEDNLEEMISYLKRSAVMVRDNGFVNFCSIYKTWEMNDAEESIDINLVCGPEGLAWNIFKKSTNENCFLDFQKTTIPSLQCHPEIIELIEKIKTETFDNMPLLYCLMTDFQVRVTEPEEFKKKFEEARQLFDEAIKYRTEKAVAMQIGGVIGSIGVFTLTCDAISAGAVSIGAFFGGGTLGAFAAGSIGFCAGPLIVGSILALTTAGNIIVNCKPAGIVGKKFRFIKNKIKTLPQHSSLLIEIEPISLPSEIDPRMRVSKFTWAVTIVNGLKGPSRNHTAIMIEGLANEYFQGSVPDGEYFIHKSEFNPPIRSKLYSLRKLKMYIPQGMRRTEVWMRPAKQVIVMLKEIARQQHLHEEQIEREEEIKWAVTGSDSWFSGGLDNCYTWTRKSVAMVDIQLGKNFHSGMFAWPRAFTDTFKEQEKSLFDIKI